MKTSDSRQPIVRAENLSPADQRAAFADRRPAAQAQRALTELANNGPRSVAQRALAAHIVPRSGEPVLQLRRDIAGAHAFDGFGTMTLAFEERYGNATQSLVGEYGTVRFDPAAEARAERIDLVQIASLRSNPMGQFRYQNPGATEQRTFDLATSAQGQPADLPTGGTMILKDMWRTSDDEGFHMDLTGDQLLPRTDTATPDVDEAYNTERRGSAGHAAWADPFDQVRRSAGGAARIEPNPVNVQAAQTISQLPGFGRADARREAELMDFPKASVPSTFRFQTMVKGDGAAWGTVAWGFDVLEEQTQALPFVASVEPLVWTDGSTPQMQEARENFDAIMGNSGSHTSLECVNYLAAELDSEAPGAYPAALALLRETRAAFVWTLNRMCDGLDADGRARPFVLRHLAVARRVYQLLQDHGLDGETDSRALATVIGLAHGLVG